MKTIDGQAKTAEKLFIGRNQDYMNKINRKTIMKYKIMKIRMKISFIAFEKITTVKELFLNTIMRSYMSLFINNKIPISVEELMR